LKVVSKEAASVEWVVVKRKEDNIWLVSHDGRSISVHSTEEQALSAAFALASERKRQGFEAVVVIARER
jgi:ribosomal protein S4E